MGLGVLPGPKPVDGNARLPAGCGSAASAVSVSAMIEVVSWSVEHRIAPVGRFDLVGGCGR